MGGRSNRSCFSLPLSQMSGDACDVPVRAAIVHLTLHGILRLTKVKFTKPIV